jgi:hypothetical protein
VGQDGRAVGATRLGQGVVKALGVAVGFVVFELPAQYVSKVARNFSRSAGVSAWLRRTFHSSPSSIAAWERFEEPTWAVEKPLSRWKCQTFVCRRVVRVSYDTFTRAPRLAGRSIARRSVAPM